MVCEYYNAFFNAKDHAAFPWEDFFDLTSFTLLLPLAPLLIVLWSAACLRNSLSITSYGQVDLKNTVAQISISLFQYFKENLNWKMFVDVLCSAIALWLKKLYPHENCSKLDQHSRIQMRYHLWRGSWLYVLTGKVSIIVLDRGGVLKSYLLVLLLFGNMIAALKVI